jgi:hypothetical protein
MKKIIRLTERDLTRIVKRVINESKKEELVSEQTLWMLNRIGNWSKKGLDAAQTGGNINYLNSGMVPFTATGTRVDKPKSLSNLFYWGTKNTGTSDVDYKTKIKKLYNAMDGAGTWEDDVSEVLGSLKNMNQLSTLIRHWKSNTGTNESLYDWLIGDLDEDEIWDAIGSWKDKYIVWEDYEYEAYGYIA